MTFRASDMDTFSQRSARDLATIGSTRARYSLNLFGDVGGGGIIASGGSFPGRTTFGINNFALLFTGDLEKSIKFVAELSVEPDETNQIGIDAERLSIRWTAPNGMYVEAGKTHLDVGYWNNAYHHGSWLQPTILRPRAVRFEDSGGILPVHVIGVSTGWLANLGQERFFRMSLGVANSRGYQEDDLQYKFDSNPDKQFSGALELKGLGLRDLRFGVSAVYGQIAADARRINPSGLNEYIGAAHIAYPGANLTLLAEMYAIDHTIGPNSWQTYDGFVVVGYRFGDFTPYGQFERLVGVGGSDPFYVIDPSQPIAPALVNMSDLDVAEGIGGLRWDMTTWCALKLEYRHAYFYDHHLTTEMGYGAWQFGL
jgi:hypothetical protein